MSDAYKLKRQDLFLGKKLQFGETGSIKLLRLAKRNEGLWMRPVHEIWQTNHAVDTLKSPLMHESAESIAGFVSKLNRYSTQNAHYLLEQGIHAAWWHIIAYPVAKFIKNYIVLKGFRDGTHGFLHAVLMSFHSFLTRAKLYLLWHQTS